MTMCNTHGLQQHTNMQDDYCSDIMMITINTHSSLSSGFVGFTITVMSYLTSEQTLIV